MAYTINDEKLGLDDLRKRIQETDLVPSRQSLLEDIETKFKKLAEAGISTAAQFRQAVKSKKKLEELAEKAKLDEQYLTLLRREIESWFPKPFPLTQYDWLPGEMIEKLISAGIKNSKLFFEKFYTKTARQQISAELGIELSQLEQLIRLTDLNRVQWVNPNTARMLVEAGFDSLKKLAAADAHALDEGILRINAGNKYFKGRVGFRDVQRLIKSAGYLPLVLE